MKRKFQFLLMILCLGIFIMPKQIIFAQSKTMECCQKKNDSSKSCHKQKGNCNSQHNKKGNDCSGNCCTSCGICSAFQISIMKSENFISLKKQNLIFKTQNFSYSEPFFNFYLKEIWQPPKIS